MSSRWRRSIIAVLLAIGPWTVGRSQTSAGVSPQAAAQLAQAWLDSDDDDGRQALQRQLSEFTGDIDEVLALLQRRSFEPVEPGYHPAEHFQVPRLAEAHPDDLLYFLVPESYRSDCPTGLIVFLHGGGSSSSPRAPRYNLNFLADADDDSESQLGELFDDSGMIAVGPSAPWNEESSYRWCLSEADDYLQDVVLECKARFNIDSDRVFLLGHSMGGFGVYHHVQRSPDRYAAAVVSAGSWTMAHWPVIQGTKLHIVQGAEDAVDGERWHWTDVAYGRWTEKLLRRHNLAHDYFEHAHGHWVGHGRDYLRNFFRTAPWLRRDPCYPRVTVATPLGFMASYSYPVQHNRWLTLDETTEGEIEYDRLLADEDVEFDAWELEHRVELRGGAAATVENRGDNVFDLRTTNVARCTLWLHPRMIDAARPVKVVVNGAPGAEQSVRPSLLTALESYERRRDWGLVYPMKIELEITDAWPSTVGDALVNRSRVCSTPPTMDTDTKTVRKGCGPYRADSRGEWRTPVPCFAACAENRPMTGNARNSGLTPTAHQIRTRAASGGRQSPVSLRVRRIDP